MKIGILTYHHVVNIGSVLQASCLFKLLSALAPRAAIEIIDYTPTASILYNQARFGISRAGRRTQRQYSSYLRQHCNFSRPVPDDKDPERVVKAIDALGYDVVIVGSDTVFQLNGSFGRPIAAEYPPNPYFLPGPASFKKIGFAVSCDPYTGSEEESRRLSLVAEYLRDFEFIFYRDDFTRELLIQAGVGPSRLDWVPDPTMFFNLNPIKSQVRESSSPRAAIYLGIPSISKSIAFTLQSAGSECIDLQTHGASSRVLPWSTNTIDRTLAAYYCVDLLVTDRFHGSILSLQRGVTGIVGIEDSSRYILGISKVRDLYTRLGILDHLLVIDTTELGPRLSEKLCASHVLTPTDLHSKFASLASTGLKTLQKLKPILYPGMADRGLLSQPPRL